MYRNLVLVLILVIANKTNAQVGLAHELSGDWTYVTITGDSTIQQFRYGKNNCIVNIEMLNGGLKIIGEMQYRFRRKQMLKNNKAIVSEGIKRYVISYTCKETILVYGYRCDSLGVTIRRRFGSKTWNLDLARINE